VTFSPDSDWIRIALPHARALLGTAAGSALFVIALLASGQSSHHHGDTRGQVVMEGFMHWRLRPAAPPHHPPAGDHPRPCSSSEIRGDESVNDLLTLSQVVLRAAIAVRDVSAVAFHEFRQKNGQMETWLVSDAWRLEQCDNLLTAMDFYGLPESLKSAWHIIVANRRVNMYKTILLTLDCTPPIAP